MKTALICGVSGQDGALLAQLLLTKGYTVFGGARDAQVASFANLKRLGIRDRVTTLSLSLTDFRSVIQALIKVRPDEIYNLSGQTSVSLSFEQPVETLESISVAAINLLESIRITGLKTRLYNASSSECFGNSGPEPSTEERLFHPRSPYGVAKAAAHWQVANYREAYGLFCCSGILFNHESPLRPERFVTRKVIAAVVSIARGSRDVLELGNLDIVRDWGWAPEYVKAMWLMLQQEQAEDYVICTGRSVSLRDFVKASFGAAGLDWQAHVRVKNEFYRASDINESRGSSAKALRKLGWKANLAVEDVVQRMLLAEQGASLDRILWE
jgi:GDPmannose 4,6-dehydratase